MHLAAFLAQVTEDLATSYPARRNSMFYMSTIRSSLLGAVRE